MKPPGQDRDLCYTNSDPKPARIEWILSPNFREDFQAQKNRGCSTDVPTQRALAQGWWF